MKTNQLKHFIIITITSLGLLLGNCTNRQVSSSGKVALPQAPEIQNMGTQQNNTPGRVKVAQGNSLPIATYDRNASNLITKIYFKNSSVVFDVYENNPYNKLNCGQVYSKTKSLGNNYGSIKGKKIKDFVKNFSALPYNPSIKENDLVDTIASYANVGYSENMKWHYVFYTIQLFADNIWAASNSTIVILDSLGHEKSVLKNIGTNINICSITNDGKYLAFGFGFDSESDYILKKGCKVYDLEHSDKLIYDQVDPETTPYIYSDLLFVIKEYYKEDIRLIDLIIYDLYNELKYSGTFKAEDIDFTKIDKEGIGKKSGDKQKLLFNRDFKVEGKNLK